MPRRDDPEALRQGGQAGIVGPQWRGAGMEEEEGPAGAGLGDL